MNLRFRTYFKNIIILLLYLTSYCAYSSNDNNGIYNFAGIIPFVRDTNNDIWVYLGVEYNKNKQQLAILAGQKTKDDKSSIDTAIREFNEETLDVFEQYINLQSIKKLEKDINYQITYNILFLLNTKIYLAPINNFKIHQNQSSCDKFIKHYNKRRYKKPYHYSKLNLSQRETYGLRRVKLSDLIDFLNDPAKFDNKLINYGSKKCNTENRLPLRWSSKILLQDQYVINNLHFSTS